VNPGTGGVIQRRERTPAKRLHLASNNGPKRPSLRAVSIQSSYSFAWKSVERSASLGEVCLPGAREAGKLEHQRSGWDADSVRRQPRRHRPNCLELEANIFPFGHPMGVHLDSLSTGSSGEQKRTVAHEWLFAKHRKHEARDGRVPMINFVIEYIVASDVSHKLGCRVEKLALRRGNPIGDFTRLAP
jgi:hypothetical protein